MPVIKETLWDKFFNRLPESAANQAIRTLKKGGTYKDVDFFTVKESEAQVERFRHRAKTAISDYRRWKAAQAVNGFLEVFRKTEGTALRNHARSMTELYSDARRDHKDLTDLLMASIDNDPIFQSKKEGGRHAK